MEWKGAEPSTLEGKTKNEGGHELRKRRKRTVVRIQVSWDLERVNVMYGIWKWRGFDLFERKI